jgi:ABC-2 type transport system permease protein
MIFLFRKLGGGLSKREAIMADLPLLAERRTFLPMLILARRELVRFYRQRSRIIGALASPLIFWFLLGSGLGKTFQSPDAPLNQGYLEYFFPGTIAMVLLFTSIFSTISLIEDRQEGFLQSVLVAPVTRLGVVGGKVLGGTALSLIQGLLFLALAPLVGFSLSVGGVLLAVVAMTLLSFCLTSIGFLFAWKLNSVQGFHAIMNVLLFPMWLLSGALFPVDTAPLWLRVIMRINPMTYGVSLLRSALYSGAEIQPLEFPSTMWSLLITLAFGVVFYVVAAVLVSRPGKESYA